MIARIFSFILSLYLSLLSFFGLPTGYETRNLFNDPDFSCGFSVVAQQAVNNNSVKLGNFIYSDSTQAPSWLIAQWNSGECLWNSRIESDIYTITDGKTKTVRYNPADCSVSMRLNAAKVYNGEAAGEYNWPHLLLEQSPIVNYNELTEAEKSFYNCSSDRMILSLDIRLSDFVDTTNKEGVNAAQYLAYFYLKGTDSNDFIWFGVNLFDDRGYQDTYWALDESSGNMIYCVSTADTFGGKNKSLFRNGCPYISDEWTHIELDLTPHIKSALKQANKSDTFGKTVSPKDFYIGGTNIGFEIHGNYDCTVDIRNFNITSYCK